MLHTKSDWKNNDKMGKSDWKNNRKSQKVTGKITEKYCLLV